MLNLLINKHIAAAPVELNMGNFESWVQIHEMLCVENEGFTYTLEDEGLYLVVVHFSDVLYLGTINNCNLESGKAIIVADDENFEEDFHYDICEYRREDHNTRVTEHLELIKKLKKQKKQIEDLELMENIKQQKKQRDGERTNGARAWVIRIYLCSKSAPQRHLMMHGRN